jgi:hypothetical protein
MFFGVSTATALVRVIEDLMSAKVTVHVILHFSKAFDLINHGLFVHKLDSRYGLVSSFLRDRSMVVEVDGVKSAPRYLSSGVPQGCIPSTLFILCELCSCIRFSKFHFYADDLQIYLSEDKKDLDEMISALNEDLAAISHWLAENGLVLNPRKSQAILISNSAVSMVLPSLFLGTEEIPWCDAVTDLGVDIDGRHKGVFESLCHTTQTAFAEVPDAEAGQIEAL